MWNGISNDSLMDCNSFIQYIKNTLDVIKSNILLAFTITLTTGFSSIKEVNCVSSKSFGMPESRFNTRECLSLFEQLSTEKNVGIDSFEFTPTVPRPEHPRPDMFRENWMTLNGEWQFEIDKEGDGESRGLTYGKDLEDRIIVPFCPESKLSGLGFGNTRKLKNVWYRRTFELPAAMLGKRIRIHFGGVDYKAWVFVNGQFAGKHIGESVDFIFEITNFLRKGENEVVVKVVDDQWSGLQPRGKQANGESRNVFYTRTTGIWQPVWLEAVGSCVYRKYFGDSRIRTIRGCLLTQRSMAQTRILPFMPKHSPMVNQWVLKPEVVPI